MIMKYKFTKTYKVCITRLFEIGRNHLISGEQQKLIEKFSLKKNSVVKVIFEKRIAFPLLKFPNLKIFKLKKIIITLSF